MTPSQRIVFNALATYGRMVFAVVFSLYSSRWVLNGLGCSDFGLVGVVGALLVFISFFNTVLGGSIGRYYAFVIGQHRVEPKQACPELTQWFNTALCVHTVVPTVLLMVGAPIGFYAIGHWLVIPPERVTACFYMFAFSLVTTFVNMTSIPFISFYSAWQRFAELMIWECMKTVLMFVFAYSLLFYEGDRLIYYSCYSMGVICFVTGVQMFRAWRHFKPCQIKPRLWWNKRQLRELLAFSGWQLFGCAGGLLRNQGSAVVINLLYAPIYDTKVNGSFNIANQLSAQTASLSNAMVTALTPALTSAEGGGDGDKVKSLALQTCKFGTLLILLASVPLVLEINEVLMLWLKQQPIFAADLCVFIILTFITDKLTTGYMPAIMAKGKIAVYQVVTGGFLISTVPLVYLFAKFGFSPRSVGAAFLITTIGSSCSRLYFGQKLVGIKIMTWAKSVFLPLMLTLGASFAFGYVLLLVMDRTVGRLLLMMALTSVTTLGLSWMIVLSARERQWILTNTIFKVMRRLKCNG